MGHTVIVRVPEVTSPIRFSGRHVEVVLVESEVGLTDLCLVAKIKRS